MKPFYIILFLVLQFNFQFSESMMHQHAQPNQHLQPNQHSQRNDYVILFVRIDMNKGDWRSLFKRMNSSAIRIIKKMCRGVQRATIFYASGHRSSFIEWKNSVISESEHGIRSPEYDKICDINIVSHDETNRKSINAIYCPYKNGKIFLAQNSEYYPLVLFHNSQQKALVFQMLDMSVSDVDPKTLLEIFREKHPNQQQSKTERDFFNLHNVGKFHFCASLFRKLSNLERIKLAEEEERYLKTEVDTVKFAPLNMDIRALWCSTNTEFVAFHIAVIPHSINEKQFFAIHNYKNVENNVEFLDLTVQSLPYNIKKN